MKIIIEDIPYESATASRAHLYQEAVEKLNVGQSFVVPVGQAVHVRNVINKRKFVERKYKSRKMDQETIRFFRIL